MHKQPNEANPHHVILVADPQLVDPHTYPGRPWPLSAFTVSHTDSYIRKSFRLLQGRLSPDTVIFLGDLFDGGREWSTIPKGLAEDHSPDQRWHKYGQQFWLKEYIRFGRCFLDPWLKGEISQRASYHGRKLIAELPGNHDLGFGNGIRWPVRQRFNAYFGEGNRVDVIGNHTFVSLDTVSLSAKGQSDSGPERQGERLWDVVENFLSSVKALKARMIYRELRLQAGLPEALPQDHTVLELNDTHLQESASNTHLYPNIPSILLTHVPLYRASGTPCGQLRERYPPSSLKQGESDVVEKDDRNALPVVAGLQYQTVLTPSISNEIIEKVGDIEAAFSGDDHDYCEVVHRGYTSKNGGIREITVKAMSWAAGIRKPGFLMLSLWNPVDSDGNPTAPRSDATRSRTMETHLCLLPDQLSIFIRYGQLFLATLLALFVHAFIWANRCSMAHTTANGNILPISKEDAPFSSPEYRSTSARAFTNNNLAARSSVVRTRNANTSIGYGIPNEEIRSPYCEEQYEPTEKEHFFERHRRNEVPPDVEPKRRRRGYIYAVFRLWVQNMWRVAIVVLVWYFWLAWKI